MSTRRTILIAPLNWGLGHATRCIPLIHELQHHHYNVLLASDGGSLLLLRKEFPDLPSIELPSYNIRYSKKGRFFKWAILKRIPNLLKVISEEKKIAEHLISDGKISGIISDNRLGLYSHRVPSVYITHQLNVLSGITTLLTSKAHQKLIRKFDECWVPDYDGASNLSGYLGHTDIPDIRIKYLGALSRMKKLELPEIYDVLILLSGPEPQRALLEKSIIEIFKNKPIKALLIRGVIGNVQTRQMNGNMEVVNYMLKKELETAINSSNIVISRSGYTTIMDLSVLEKKVFFIPTPGQYEQEYLAKRCKDLGMAPFCKQKDFSYEKLNEISKYHGLKDYHQKINYKELFALFKGE